MDGKYLGGGDTNVKSKGFFVYELMAGSYVIALSCKASPPPWSGGILASFDNGLVTDPSWKCITTATFGWNTRNYQDHDWPMATSYGPNYPWTLPWGEIPSIDKNAVWIWSKDNQNDTEIYCRRNLVEPCTKGKLINGLWPDVEERITDFKFSRQKTAFCIALSVKKKKIITSFNKIVKHIIDSPVGLKFVQCYDISILFPFVLNSKAKLLPDNGVKQRPCHKRFLASSDKSGQRNGVRAQMWSA